MYLTSFQRVKDQWVLNVATSQKTWDGLSVGDVLYYGDGREGIISAKVEVAEATGVSGGEYLNRGIKVAFPVLPKDRIFSEPWMKGYISLDSGRPGSVADVVGEVPTKIVEGGRRAAEKIADLPGNLWDAIPSWIKWGALGAGVLYIAGPYLLPSEER